ncbi:MAG: dihydroorotate dehydrogenase electron transfer subunit [Dethiobacteria bacterium]
MNKGRVNSIKKVTADCYLLKLEPALPLKASPGQFIFIRTAEMTDPLLRRPFSIHYCDPEGRTVWILFRVVGRGTSLMAALTAGDTVDYIGPLGTGFHLGPDDREVILVSGGVGLAPLFYWASHLHERGVAFDFLHGADTEKNLLPADYFIRTGSVPMVATEDGTSGYKGRVTDLFELIVNKKARKADRLYACGPLPMLSSLVRSARKAGIPSQVSLEAEMACGVGACLGCVCEIGPRSEKGAANYRRVCKDGPVFPGEAVIFDES